MGFVQYHTERCNQFTRMRSCTIVTWLQVGKWPAASPLRKHATVGPHYLIDIIRISNYPPLSSSPKIEVTGEIIVFGVTTCGIPDTPVACGRLRERPHDLPTTTRLSPSYQNPSLRPGQNTMTGRRRGQELHRFPAGERCDECRAKRWYAESGLRYCQNGHRIEVGVTQDNIS
jgi:hypothetical protein